MSAIKRLPSENPLLTARAHGLQIAFERIILAGAFWGKNNFQGRTNKQRKKKNLRRILFEHYFRNLFQFKNSI